MNGFERRKQQKKRDILKATLALFKNYGVQKVSIAEIASKANVSQVTIYNYFGNKDQLIHEVIIFYVDQVWAEYEGLFYSNAPFQEKITKIIFGKKKEASHLNEDFFEHFMAEYTDGSHYIEKLFTEKALPRFIELFREGKEQGYIDSTISNEAILLYFQMFTDYLRRKDTTKDILPMTEELTKLFFYGIVGKQTETDDDN
ncbi:TetR family transcriptional regulator [Bacillus sp. J14TS2]|uniref:TetR/AcrR family transcriptional regulator n=1 Tax=Bacillus sp. J14TS2 TaxID=2807188 RepID=UPI001B1D24DC|nr:TetR/AcrR family transcriptional regulator [Bacillus sp. J14TS2]GIN72717.1 TetR family transcriptional regulator [Bacillus sp. J14TS2]